jgi:hypothetical protein
MISKLRKEIVIMDSIKRRDALKIVLGGIGGIALADKLSPSGIAASKAQGSAQRAGRPEVMAAFPSAGRYEIRSKPIFRVSKGNKSEIIVCEGKLAMRTGSPFLNENKTRQVDVEVLEWKGTGYSELLGGPIDFRMVKPASARRAGPSYILGGALRDFPASANLTIDYEMKTPFGTQSGLSGVVRGVIRALPLLPADLLSMDKADPGPAKPAGILSRDSEIILITPIAWAS